MPRVALAKLRAEILAKYAPPCGAKNSWFKFRQVMDILETIGVKTTADLGTAQVIPRFLASNPKWKPETVKGMLGYLSPVCKHAKIMGYIRVNPFDLKENWYKAPMPVESDETEEDDWDWDTLDGMPAHLSIEELSRLLEYLGSHRATWKGARLYALVATFAYTGLRRNEALTRSVKDFNLSRRIMRITARRRRLKTEQSNQPVGLPSELVPILEDWLPRTGSRWAFPGVRGQTPWLGGPVGGRAIDELKAAGLACGIGKVNFLMLRHSWATHAELRGIGELMVQRQLRHTSKRTQLHYRHADLTNLANAVEGFSLRVVGQVGQGHAEVRDPSPASAPSPSPHPIALVAAPG